MLETMPDADWGMEIKMVEMYLEKDGRNCASVNLPGLRRRKACALTYGLFGTPSPQLGLSPLSDLVHP